jgi:CheY-like chemotaxis protein
MADDDEDDCIFAKDAFNEIQVRATFFCVEDGIELMDYLHRSGKYAERANEPLPSLILLDLNMPRKGGAQALKEIKSEPALQHIPVAVLTTSREKEQLVSCREMGAVSLITKPALFAEWIEIMKSLAGEWLGADR